MKVNQLTEPTLESDITEDIDNTLLARLERLEAESLETAKRSEQRVTHAGMKIAATRSGMIDLDGLKFLDLTQVHLDDNDEVIGGAELIEQLKRTKPWLFSASSSSSVARVPPSKPTRQKLATDMTDEEYRAARAIIVRQSLY